MRNVSGSGELLANQSQPNQPCPHGEFRVLRAAGVSGWRFAAPFASSGKGQGKAECSFSIARHASPFFFTVVRLGRIGTSRNSIVTFGKGRMEVQHMVSAVVVVLISAVILHRCAVYQMSANCAIVGEAFSGSACSDELGIDRSAISVASCLGIDFQGICNQADSWLAIRLARFRRVCGVCPFAPM